MEECSLHQKLSDTLNHNKHKVRRKQPIVLTPEKGIQTSIDLYTDAIRRQESFRELETSRITSLNTTRFISKTSERILLKKLITEVERVIDTKRIRVMNGHIPMTDEQNEVETILIETGFLTKPVDKADATTREHLLFIKFLRQVKPEKVEEVRLSNLLKVMGAIIGVQDLDYHSSKYSYVQRRVSEDLSEVQEAKCSEEDILESGDNDSFLDKNVSFSIDGCITITD